MFVAFRTAKAVPGYEPRAAKAPSFLTAFSDGEAAAEKRLPGARNKNHQG